MKLVYLEEIDSTNAYVKSNINELDDMTVVYTSHQINGRGRLDRKWHDVGSENIYLTFCLKPSTSFLPVFSNMSQYLSVVLCKTLEMYNIQPSIKWPNDVLVNDKKIAGILAESTMKGNKFLGMALGVGVNLNANIENLSNIDKPATALNILLSKQIDRDEFLNSLTDNFFLLYNKFREDGFKYIRDDYLKRAFFIGREITVNILGTVYPGRAIDVNNEGALLMNIDGKINKFLIGDIL